MRRGFARALGSVLLALSAAGAAAEAPRLGVLAGVPAAAAVLLSRGGEGGPLPMAAGVFPFAPEGGTSRALLVVEIDGRTLATAVSGPRLGLELHVYVVTPDGRIASSRSEAIAVDLAEDAERLSVGGLRWVAAIARPGGPHAVRIHAREHASGAFGQREVRIGPEGPPGLAAPAASLPWLELVSPSLSAADRDALAAAGGAPAAIPVLVAGATARLRLWGAPQSAGPTTLDLLDARGLAVAALATRIEGSRTVASGLRIDSYAVDLPAGLSGRYAIAAPAGTASRVLVRSADGVAWNRLPDLDLGAARSEEASAPEAAGAGRGRIEQARSWRQAWLGAWRRYASGDREGALGELIALEAAIPARRAAARIAEVEDPMIDDLAAEDPEILLPLCQLYLELARAALAEGRIPTATRARGVAERLATRFAAASATPEARRTAAALLETLAADRLEARDSAGAAALLERAAAVEPGSGGPWLTIGILFERDRVLDRARAAFERVLAAEPGHREARLRRARVDLLAGRAGAQAELERLAAEELDWIGVVAVEELARRMLAEGRIDAAIEMLAPRVAARPEEASLTRALAYALDRSGRRVAAREHVARAAAATGRPGGSPRKRYADDPERRLFDRRIEVERAGMLALPRLEAALADEGPSR